MSNKTKLVELSAIELIAASSGRVVTGVNPIENHDKVSNILKTMPGYEYDNEKSLSENIYAAFPQYKIKEATEKYSGIIKSWLDRGDDLTFINTAITAGFVARDFEIPQTLHIKVNKEDVKAKESCATKVEGQTKPEAKFTYKESSYASISDWKHRDFFN